MKMIFLTRIKKARLSHAKTESPSTFPILEPFFVVSVALRDHQHPNSLLITLQLKEQPLLHLNQRLIICHKRSIPIGGFLVAEAGLAPFAYNGHPLSTIFMSPSAMQQHMVFFFFPLTLHPAILSAKWRNSLSLLQDTRDESFKVGGSLFNLHDRTPRRKTRSLTTKLHRFFVASVMNKGMMQLCCLVEVYYIMIFTAVHIYSIIINNTLI
ncbi:hypothetical protein CEXT_483091 [Caerostris extrusa]|uniref:Uncharacterized protein n=1 Tax=Caerostris extrusa TaxID=172846 RepID=A0AAV4UKF3_CAEEX|nr:hypothetical protein CEXT_483091 [Caerostris extrusa]